MNKGNTVFTVRIGYTNVIEINNENISKCAELYINVFNSEPWNDK